jgi:hypothetical protein
VRREFAVLGEGLSRALRQRLRGRQDVDVDAALALLAGFLAHAESVSVRAHGGRPGTPSASAGGPDEADTTDALRP